MSSDTDIANRAMRILKAGRITSLTDGSNNANVALDVFTEVRDDLLRSHHWNFAQKWVKLAQISTVPVFEFDHAYALPADWVKTVTVHDNDAGVSTVIYREGEVDGQGALLCSSDEIWIRYIYKATDPNRMPPDFRTAFSFALAIAMPGINNLSAGREDLLMREAKSRLRRAKHADAMGSIPERRPSGSWVATRAGWPSWRAWPD